MEVIQQLDQPLHPRTLESLVTGNPNESYNKSPQPWGEWNQVVKTDEVPSTDACNFACRFGEIIFYGQSMEKISDRFAFLALENYVDQLPVVFSVSEPDAVARSPLVELYNYVERPPLAFSASKLDAGVRLPWIEVTKAKFQTYKEEALPTLNFFAVRVYRRAPLIRNLRQAQRSDF